MNNFQATDGTADQPMSRYSEKRQKQGLHVHTYSFPDTLQNLDLAEKEVEFLSCMTSTKTMFLLSFFQIAAQNCRRRKMEQITELEEEVRAFLDRLALRAELWALWTGSTHPKQSAIMIEFKSMKIFSENPYAMIF